MSKTIACPNCGYPMDVPAYPGDGVYTKHVCPKPPQPHTEDYRLQQIQIQSRRLK